MEMSGQILTPGKNSSAHLIGGLVCPKTSPLSFEVEEISLPSVFWTQTFNPIA